MKSKYSHRITIRKVEGNKYINALVGKDFEAREIYTDTRINSIIIYPQEYSCYKKYKTLEFEHNRYAMEFMKENYEKFHENGACLLTWQEERNKLLYIADSDLNCNWFKEYTCYYPKENKISVERRINMFNEFIKEGMDPRVAKILECYFDTINKLQGDIAENNYEINNIKEQIKHIKDDISDIKWLISPNNSIGERINRERFIAQANKVRSGDGTWNRDNYVLEIEDQKKLENMGYSANLVFNL